MGQAEASTGVVIRTGPSSSSSARFVSGLVLKFGAFDYIVDNASRFGARAPLPRSVILPLGSHRVFIASVSDGYPREVQVFSGVTDLLPAIDTSAAAYSPSSCVRVE